MWEYVVEILKLGYIGFSFLLAYFAYNLLKEEGRRKDRPPDPNLLKAILFYIAGLLFLSVLTGIFHNKRISINLTVPKELPENVTESLKYEVGEIREDIHTDRPTKIVVRDQGTLILVLDALTKSIDSLDSEVDELNVQIEELNQKAINKDKSEASSEDLGIPDETW
jgi:hypothetical protein